MTGNRKNSEITLGQIERLGVRRKIHRATRSSIELHPAAGPAFTVWSEIPRLLPRYSLLNQRATRFALRQIPVQVTKKDKNTWYALAGFETYCELQALETPDSSMLIQMQQYLDAPDPHVEALSLIFLMHSIEGFCIDGSVAYEHIRRLIKTGFRQSTQDLVLTASTRSQRSFADAVGIKPSRLKRQAKKLKNSSSRRLDFAAKILAAD